MNDLVSRCRRLGLKYHAEVLVVLHSRREREGNPSIGCAIERMVLRDLCRAEGLGTDRLTLEADRPIA
jgi:hypothetical protein